MNFVRLSALLLLTVPVLAQDPPPDAVKVLNDLTAANAAKDIDKVSMLLKPIIDLGESSDRQEELDPIADELKKSLKLAKGNDGTMRKVIDAMGALRSKKTVSTLKKIGFKKKVKTEQEEQLQAHAILALSKLRDTKLLGGFEDMMKNRSVTIARAAYEAIKEYGTSKGKVRKQCAEILMKRLNAEKPAAGQSGQVSAEQQERWQKLQDTIVKSLQSVCHEATINDIENWREWWSENKKNPKRWKDKKE